MWHLGDTNLAARRTDAACPDPTQMPAEGNGVGTALLVAAAAGVGAVLVRRRRRRTVGAVAERLGHEDASLVLGTDGHLMPDSEDRTHRAVDSA